MPLPASREFPSSVPSYLKNIYKEDYSTSYFNSSTSVSGIHWGILHNVCYDIKHNKLHLYKKDGGRSLLPEHFQRGTSRPPPSPSRLRLSLDHRRGGLLHPQLPLLHEPLRRLDDSALQ